MRILLALAGMIAPALISAEEVTISRMPHSLYSKNQVVKVAKKNGEYTILKKTDCCDGVSYTVDKYTVETLTDGAKKRTVKLVRAGDETLFGIPFYKQVITMQEVLTAQGSRAGNGGPDIMDGTELHYPNIVASAIIVGGLLGIMYKMHQKIKFYENTRVA